MLGTRDYVRKCGFAKALIGLSGGIDSSLVACIAVDALGKENVTGISMPGPFSSAGSITDAQALADNLEIPMISAPITGAYHCMAAGLPKSAVTQGEYSVAASRRHDDGVLKRYWGAGVDDRQ